MPVRDFPRSTVDEYALYLHDEIRFGRVTLIPGLRWESYRLDADSDRIYAEDNPATQVVDASESELAPKLGALWHMTDRAHLYAQYAHGFRAQPFEDLNIGFDIALFNYRAIPNAELKPETSDGIEIGYRRFGELTRFTVTLFGTDYDDLIESRANLGRDENGTLIFQSRNVGKARVYGAEFTYSAALDSWLDGLSFDMAGSVTKGRNRTADEPLNTVDPAELVTSLAWSPSDRASLRMVLTAVAAKNDVDETVENQVTTDGYVVADLTGTFKLTPAVRLDAGLFNAFDKTYWQWSSVRNRTTDDPMVAYLSAPGRYASISIRVTL
jgi:hemoglobin/transferrin/lactoferrin receptor protein